MAADTNSGGGDQLCVDASGADSEVPLEVLEQQLTSWAANIAAAEARWLRWLGEYDRREGWAEWGCSSAAHWLSWKCGMTSSVARERVRVAAALVELPLIAASFGQGRLSYSKVRALTRVANAFNEPELCDMALHASGAQLEAICRGYRQSHPDRDGQVASAHERRRFSVRENYDGTATLTLVLTADQARHVAGAVQAQADQIITDALGGDPGGDDDSEGGAPTTRRKAIEARDGIAAVRADACVSLLTGASESSLPQPTDLTMVVAPHPSAADDAATTHVSAETSDLATTNVSAETSVRPDPVSAAEVAPALTVLQGQAHIAEEPARRLCCDPRITTLIENASGDPLAVGRTTRLISHHLRLALTRRDAGRCQFPGCFATHNLHAHHIIHWADGGPTELDNLLLVCHFHHHLIHDRGWTVDPATRQFISPLQHTVDDSPTCASSGGDYARIEPTRWRDDWSGRLEPPHLDPLNLGLATETLHASEHDRRALIE